MTRITPQHNIPLDEPKLDPAISYESRGSRTTHPLRKDNNLDNPGVSQKLTESKRGFGPSASSPDVWSLAFAEALDSFGSELDHTLLQGNSAESLMRRLQEMDEDDSQNSAFRRGLDHLRRLRIPLEAIKLALDIATPLVAVEPTAAMAVGVVRSVTAVSASITL